MSLQSAVGPTQKDWETREIIEVVQLNVLQITSFLNKFDGSVRTKLSQLNEKLTRLERTIELCEAASRATLSDPAETNAFLDDSASQDEQQQRE